MKFRRNYVFVLISPKSDIRYIILKIIILIKTLSFTYISSTESSQVQGSPGTCDVIQTTPQQDDVIKSPRRHFHG